MPSILPPKPSRNTAIFLALNTHPTANSLKNWFHLLSDSFASNWSAVSMLSKVVFSWLPFPPLLYKPLEQTPVIPVSMNEIHYHYHHYTFCPSKSRSQHQLLFIFSEVLQCQKQTTIFHSTTTPNSGQAISPILLVDNCSIEQQEFMVKINWITIHPPASAIFYLCLNLLQPHH